MSDTPSIERLPTGALVLTFAASLCPFRSMRAAEQWLEERGFSVGRQQAGAPRGIMFGAIDIQKWRNLRPIEVEALHGLLSGPGRSGPIRVVIFQTAPDELRRAIIESSLAATVTEMTTLECVADAAAVVTLCFVAALILALFWRVDEPPLVNKIALRASFGTTSAQTEARR